MASNRAEYADLDNTPYYAYAFRDLSKQAPRNPALDCAKTANELEQEEQCVTCGDYHEGIVPWGCESGDRY